MISGTSSLTAYSRVQAFAAQAAKIASPSTQATFAQSASLSSAPSATTVGR